MLKKYGYSYRNPLFVGKALLYKKLEKVLPELHGFVLDCGAGTQPYKSLLPKEKTKYFNFDYNASLKPAVIADSRYIPFKDGLFDAIIITEVLEHVFETRMVLNELFRLLKPGGIVVCSTPFTWGLHYDPYDFYRFTPYALRRLFTENGFVVDSLVRTGGLFSAMYQRTADVLFHALNRFLMAKLRMTNTLSERILKTLIQLPNALAIRILPLFDYMDQRDALTFFLTAKKKADGA